MNPSRLILALDLPSLDEARSLASSVREAVGMIKVGLELFVAAGPNAVALGTEVERPVFLDLKLHDIPETVERAVARASSHGARMLTVHAAGGRTMLRRAVDRAHREGAGLEIVAVTVLTSLDAQDLVDVGVHDGVVEQAQRLARMAWDEGVRSFVCSPREVGGLRSVLGPDAVLVTPGVRPTADSGDDQKRTLSAAAAVSAGANWVVVGRPIRDARDPLAAARALALEVERASAP